MLRLLCFIKSEPGSKRGFGYLFSAELRRSECVGGRRVSVRTGCLVFLLGGLVASGDSCRSCSCWLGGQMSPFLSETIPTSATAFSLSQRFWLNQRRADQSTVLRCRSPSGGRSRRGCQFLLPSRIAAFMPREAVQQTPTNRHINGPRGAFDANLNANLLPSQGGKQTLSPAGGIHI